MPQITIKTEHIKLLKQLGVYNQWLNNTKLSMESDYDTERNLSKDTFYKMVTSSFFWNDTAEGSEFWRDIANK